MGYYMGVMMKTIAKVVGVVVRSTGGAGARNPGPPRCVTVTGKAHPAVYFDHIG
jgi:hypothetical protein